MLSIKIFHLLDNFLQVLYNRIRHAQDYIFLLLLGELFLKVIACQIMLFQNFYLNYKLSCNQQDRHQLLQLLKALNVNPCAVQKYHFRIFKSIVQFQNILFPPSFPDLRQKTLCPDGQRAKASRYHLFHRFLTKTASGPVSTGCAVTGAPGRTY